MRAAVWRGTDAPLLIEEVELAPPGPGEVEVEIAACAICHSDIAYLDGGWAHPLPAVFGHEAAGRVTATGPGAAVARGARVAVTLARACGICPECLAGAPTNCAAPPALSAAAPLRDGTGAPVAQGMNAAAFAERVVVHESQIAPIPDGLGWAAASVISCGVLTGVGAALRTAKVKPGARVAVIGVGGVGLNCVQGARLAGAAQIIAVDLSPEKRDAARRFGATDALEGGEGAAEAVRAATGGRGVDAVFVCVGNAGVIDGAGVMAARGGAVVIVGMPPDGAISRYDPSALAAANQSILGSRFGQAVVSEDVPQLCAHWERGELLLDELVSEVFPFERIAEAVDATRRGRGLRNVVMFDWARGESA